MFSKYFQKSFGEAYMRQGRVQLVLRLSHFVKQKCISLNLNKNKLYKYFDSNILDTIDFDKRYTLMGCASMIFKLANTLTADYIPDVLYLPTLYGFDQVAQHIYSHFSMSTIQVGGKLNRNTKAYPEPTRKFEYTCVNDPLKVLQYLISRQDFHDDNLRLSDITVFLKDIQIMESLAKRLNINLLDISIKEINVMAEVSLSSKGGGKPMLLNFDPKNDLFNSIVAYIESQSMTGRYCTVNTGIYEEFIPRSQANIFEQRLTTVQHPLEYGWETQTSELLNDLAMLLSFCSAAELPEKDTRNILKSLKFSLDNTITSSDYIERIGSMYLSNQLKLSNTQTQIVTALCDFVNNNPLPLAKFLDTKLGYKYEYRKGSPRPGFTTVYLTILGENFIVTFKETYGKEGHAMSLTTDTKKLQILPLAYITGLRLMGNISINEYLKRTNRDMFSYLQYYAPLPEAGEGKSLYINKYTGQFSFTQNSKVDLELPIIIRNKLDMPLPKSGEISINCFYLIISQSVCFQEMQRYLHCHAGV